MRRRRVDHPIEEVPTTSPTSGRKRSPSGTVGILACTALLVTIVPVLAPAAGAQVPATGPQAVPARYTQQEPTWKPCSETAPDLECATVEAPLDYRRPERAAITVAISRIRTSTPERRRGILLINPGGPGDEGLDQPDFLRKQLPREVTERYDLVGFDPRGVGASSPVTCAIPDPPPPVPTPGNFAEQVAAARAFGEACSRSDPAIAHISTRNTARDMDLIRAVLGERKLSYLGFSYGTYLGAVYTQLFPRRADRIVLDSALDPARVHRGTFQAAAANAEAAFRRWTRWVAERDATYHLGTTPGAVRRTFWDLVARAEVDPIEIDDGAYTGDDIRFQASDQMVFLERSAEFVAALRSAAGGRPTTAARAGTGDAGAPEQEAAGGTAILCNDVKWPRDPERYRRDALRDRERYPLSGYESSTVFPCAFWENPYAETATVVRNDVRALILQNEWDWSTPAPLARGLRRAMRGSRLVLVDEGEGHIVYGKGNTCAEQRVNTYLSTGQLPGRDVTCAATREQGTPTGR